MEIPTAKQARKNVSELLGEDNLGVPLKNKDYIKNVNTVNEQFKKVAKAIQDAIKKGKTSVKVSLILMTDVENALIKKGYRLGYKGLKVETEITWSE